MHSMSYTKNFVGDSDWIAFVESPVLFKTEQAQSLGIEKASNSRPFYLTQQHYIFSNSFR